MILSNLVIFKLEMKFATVLVLLLASTTAIKISSVARPCAGGCPNTETAGLGYGKISSRSKG